MMATYADERRFWTKVDIQGPSECWNWTACLMHNGYGQFRWQGQARAAHRVAWVLVGNSIPEGMQMDHLCRNRRCCNPAHLEVVTQRENLLRGDTITARCAAKTHCPQGHPYDEANTIVYRGNRQCRACTQSDAAKKRRHAYYVRKVQPPGVIAHRARTHCPQGHPYDEQNTRWYQGRRYCRACAVIRSVAYQRKKRQQ